jgi:hypothetical protein
MLQVLPIGSSAAVPVETRYIAAVVKETRMALSPEIRSIRRKGLIALGCLIVPVLMSILPAMFGQDPAGDAMLAGVVTVVLLAVGVPMGVGAWRAATRHVPPVDGVTRLLARAPLLFLAVVVAIGIAAGLVASSSP